MVNVGIIGVPGRGNWTVKTNDIKDPCIKSRKMCLWKNNLFVLSVPKMSSNTIQINQKNITIFFLVALNPRCRRKTFEACISNWFFFSSKMRINHYLFAFYASVHHLDFPYAHVNRSRRHEKSTLNTKCFPRIHRDFTFMNQKHSITALCMYSVAWFSTFNSALFQWTKNWSVIFFCFIIRSVYPSILLNWIPETLL